MTKKEIAILLLEERNGFYTDSWINRMEIKYLCKDNSKVELLEKLNKEKECIMRSRTESKKLLSAAMETRDELIKELEGLQLIQTQKNGRVNKLFKKLQLQSKNWMDYNGIENYLDNKED